MRSVRTVRAVALFEGAKGALVFLAGFSALSLIHHDAQRLAEQLVAHLHLNPASRYPRILIAAAAHLTDARLWLLATLAEAYGLVRFVEAYCLWRRRRWAEWFAAVSGAIYIAFELYELFKGATWLSLGVLVANVFIVGLMINVLLREHPAQSANDRLTLQSSMTLCEPRSARAAHCKHSAYQPAAIVAAQRICPGNHEESRPNRSWIMEHANCGRPSMNA